MSGWWRRDCARKRACLVDFIDGALVCSRSINDLGHLFDRILADHSLREPHTQYPTACLVFLSLQG
jgi:hypothetical protein